MGLVNWEGGGGGGMVPFRIISWRVWGSMPLGRLGGGPVVGKLGGGGRTFKGRLVVKRLDGSGVPFVLGIVRPGMPGKMGCLTGIF